MSGGEAGDPGTVNRPTALADVEALLALENTVFEPDWQGVSANCRSAEGASFCPTSVPICRLFEGASYAAGEQAHVSFWSEVADSL